MRRVYFVTSNPEKQVEAKLVLEPRSIQIQLLQQTIIEPLSVDLPIVATSKVVEAYRRYHIPVFVEHGGLYIEALKGLPGCLSKLMFTALKGEICDLIRPGQDRTAIARSLVAFCDGRRIHLFTGEVNGTISVTPKGARDYYYDTVFIPEGHSQTFAEMSIEDKTRISHVKQAYEAFASHLTTARV
ncbi:MAG TPA: non-canonical purine NTP pyrophosphatase [Chloroflexia bacterium]|jgi:XTP/dITP diphosphohydrolase